MGEWREGGRAWSSSQVGGKDPEGGGVEGGIEGGMEGGRVAGAGGYGMVWGRKPGRWAEREAVVACGGSGRVGVGRGAGGCRVRGSACGECGRGCAGEGEYLVFGDRRELPVSSPKRM